MPTSQRALLTLLLVLTLCTCGRAQNTIAGTVVDASSAAPLPYVYLKLDGVALGTVTENDGSYRIDVPRRYDDRTITFSYLGYQNQAILVSELRKRSEPIRLKSQATELAEITVTPKKLPSANAILRRAMSNVKKNYPQDVSLLEGYYRETLKENGEYIKLADAAVRYRSEPYTGKKHKWKHYQNVYGFGTTLGSSVGSDARKTLHRIHFHHRTLKNDQVEIVDARASENGSSLNQNANILGGPLSLFARDRVRFQESFLGRKRKRDFNYLVDEVKDENGKWVYALHFRTTITKTDLDNAELTEKDKRRGKQWQMANKHKLLAGTLFIDQEDYAILGYNCHVPNELKPYFCGYKTMAIKHFDYKLDVRFKQVNGVYLIDYLRHEDEFIIKDTVTQTTTPYAAISEFTRLDQQLTNIPTLDKEKLFKNVNLNELYEYPLEYDSTFWADFFQEHPQVAVGPAIREELSREKPLERQFRDRLERDPNMPAPVAAIDPTVTEIHGVTLTDDYAWLKETKAPNANDRVMDYLRAENDYAENYFKPLRKLQRQVFRELSFYVKKNYTSLPTRSDGYLYYSAYSGDQEHPVYYRTPVDKPATKDTLIDVNVEAEKHDYYTVGGLQVSPNTNLMAFAENTTGSDRYVVRFKNLTDGTLLTDSLQQVGGMVWLDDETVLYVVQEPKTLRAYKVMRHRLGTPQARDEEVFREDDPQFGVGIGKSRSKQFIYLSTGSNDATEAYILRTDDPNGTFRMVRSRESKERYSITDHEDKFYILTDAGKAVDGKIMVTDTSKLDAKHWKVFMPHRKGVMLNGFTFFDNYLVVAEQEEVQSRLRVIDRRSGDEHYIKIKKEDIYGISLGYNPVPGTDTLQFSYSSFATPTRTINYHMGTKEQRLVRKARSIRWTKGYLTKRLWATAKDGTKVPITLVSNKWRDGKKGDNNRVYLTSYGAYGSGSGVGFSSFVQTLVERGFTYAIAHVRGGNDLGMHWYEDGRMLNKQNTFDDFIACAEHLIEEGYAAPGTITAQGGSAGGLLMGAVVNKRPELFRAVFLDVPFVDVINTMLDPKLPLTTGEYLEWGNPNEKKYFKYMLEYSPYENVTAQAYPHLFFSTGLNDTRVGYWEPAKMVAKLRSLKTNDNLLFLKTDLNAGHGGAAGRFAGLRETAYKLALLFDLYAEEEGVK